MNKITFARVIILYNPNEEEKKRIHNNMDLFDFTMVYDNSPVVDNELLNSQEIKYMGSGINYGLAIPYNWAIQHVYECGYDWLMLQDQDSDISSESIKLIKKYILESNTENVSIVAPYVQYYDSNVNNTNNKVVDWVINSGAFLNLKYLKENNIKYDNNYFIDRLDRDFCMRVRRKSLIVQVAGTLLVQKLGTLKNGVVVHSPIRNYYIFRNRLYYNKKYNRLVPRMFINIIQILKHVFLIVRSRDNVICNFKMMYLGLVDYLMNRMGSKK